MSFTIKDKKYLQKYKLIWDKTKNIIENNFNKQPVNTEKYLNTTLKLFNSKNNTKFYNNNGNPTKPSKKSKNDSSFSYHYIPGIVHLSVSKIRKEDGDKYYQRFIKYHRLNITDLFGRVYLYRREIGEK